MKGLKELLIRRAIDWYRIDMNEALESDPQVYRSLNDFFTRALRPDARPLAEAENAITCPADGALSQAGDIEDGYLFQAKGHNYALQELLGGDPAMTSSSSRGASPPGTHALRRQTEKNGACPRTAPQEDQAVAWRAR
ncbi:MAG: phosphatidylserine decarboxylase [Candidatus Thiodiazotropha sp.]